MAEGLFFLMIGLVCAFTIILLFCEYSCRGGKTSSKETEFDKEEGDRQEEEQALTSNNNGSNEEVDNVAAQLPCRKKSAASVSFSGRRSSIKVLVRKESTTVAPSMV